MEEREREREKEKEREKEREERNAASTFDEENLRRVVTCLEFHFG